MAFYIPVDCEEIVSLRYENILHFKSGAEDATKTTRAEKP